MSRPNLILGICVGYTAEAAEIFIRSWRRNVPSAALHMFVKDIAPDLAALLRDNDVQTTDCAMALDVAADLGFNIYSARQFVLRRFLQRNPCHGKVLLSDVRDVVLQGDPFAESFAGDVLFAAEDKKIEDCRINSAWISQAYGQDVLRVLRSRTVTCAGTVLGSYIGILRYLDLMCAELKSHPKQETDQGIHNFIAWGLSPIGMAVDLSNGVVATLDQIDAERVTFEDGMVRLDGHAPPIVHQWDRQDHLRGPLLRAWSAG